MTTIECLQINIQEEEREVSITGSNVRLVISFDNAFSYNMAFSIT